MIEVMLEMEDARREWTDIYVQIMLGNLNLISCPIK